MGILGNNIQVVWNTNDQSVPRDPKSVKTPKINDTTSSQIFGKASTVQTEVIQVNYQNVTNEIKTL